MQIDSSESRKSAKEEKRTNMRFKQKKIDLPYQDLTTVTTEAGRVYTTPAGLRYPSITTVLGKYADKSGLDEWKARVGEVEAAKILRQAGRRGTIVHEAMENYINGNPLPKLMPHHQRSIKLLSGILDKSLTEVYAQEVPLYSDYLKVAGRVDLVGKFDNRVSIIDFKTSRKRKEKSWISNYFMQASAYAIMFEERTGIPVADIAIIMDVDHEDPIVFKEKRDNWTKELMSVIRDFYERENNQLHNT